jgi:glycine/D-amino acid oxidase-like deaminating enzyme
LHAELSKEHDGSSTWGYRLVASADCDLVKEHPDEEQQTTSTDGKYPVLRSPADVDWVKPNIFKWFMVEGETAQVHPLLFTKKIARLAQDRGVNIHYGRAKSVKLTQDNHSVQSVLFQPKGSEAEQELLATDVVVTAGPWTRRVLPEAPVGGQLSTSIVVDPKREISPIVLFFDPGNFDSVDSKNSMEIYPRPDSTVYISGQSDRHALLPDSTEDVRPDPARVEKTRRSTALVSEALHKSELLYSQSCFRPVVEVKGRDENLGPLLGETGVRGLLIGAGHNHWGIQNGPVTGKLLSELIFDGKAITADIRSLDPREHMRFVRQ